MSIFPGLSAISRGIFGTGSGFRVECHAMLFFRGFLLVLAGVSFLQGDWALAYHFMGVGYFTNIS